MRLLKIGRDPKNCDIVLYSEKVSSVHAELVLMDSGDILLEDKGSRNGTFVMNQPIKPGQPVNVKYGDTIRFADTELQWSQVPRPEDNSAYKAIFNIGKNFNNDISLNGSTVSRYHATIKVSRDNKVYIVDHSKNGTTVNGSKITPNNPYRLNRKSSIVCGGVPVPKAELDRVWKMIPTPVWKYILGTAACFLLIAIAAIFFPDPHPSLKSLQAATTCVFERYYIEVTIKDDPFIGKIKDWPTKWTFGVQDGKVTLATNWPNEDIKVSPLEARGTAFFISEKGELGTNRHIACPWNYISNDLKDNIRQQIVVSITEKANSITQALSTQVKNAFVSKYLSKTATQSDYAQTITDLKNIDAWLSRIQKSDYELSGSFEYLGIALTGTNFTTIADLHSCQVIAESGDEFKDVALIRLNSKKTPDEIVKGGFFDIEKARTDELSLNPQEDELTTIGYPAEYNTNVRIISKGTEFLPTVHRTYISKRPDDNMFQLQSNVVGGQSGSPVIDKNFRLVGVINASHRGTDVAYACNIKHLKELYDKNKARD